MKNFYFNLPAADADDAELRRAISAGHVPASCLLGGWIVWRSVAVERDPCAGCSGPRARCKGRPQMDYPDGHFGDVAAVFDELRAAAAAAAILEPGSPPEEGDDRSG